MTDLETRLRRALRVSQDSGHAPPGYPAHGCGEPAFDVAGIITRGRRLRWRRRAAAAGASLCVAAALFGAVTGFGKLATSSVHPAQRVVGPAGSVPAPSPSRVISPPSPSTTPRAVPAARPSATPPQAHSRVRRAACRYPGTHITHIGHIRPAADPHTQREPVAPSATPGALVPAPTPVSPGRHLATALSGHARHTHA